jgi:hypothetical protein
MGMIAKTTQPKSFGLLAEVRFGLLAEVLEGWKPVFGSVTSDRLASTEWKKGVEHSVRVTKRVLTFLTSRYPDSFRSKEVPWYVATHEFPPSNKLPQE